MKVECPQLKRKRYSGGKKNKSLIVTQDDLDSEKSSNLDDEQLNICLMANTDKKVKVKTCSKSDTPSNDEEDMLCDVLLQNCHDFSLV